MAVRPLQFQSKNNVAKTLFEMVKSDRKQKAADAKQAKADRNRRFQILQQVRVKMVTIAHDHDDYRLIQEIMQHPSNRVVENKGEKVSHFVWEK